MTQDKKSEGVRRIDYERIRRERQRYKKVRIHFTRLPTQGSISGCTDQLTFCSNCPTLPWLEELTRATAADVLCLDHALLTPDADLFFLGMDSLVALQIQGHICEKFGIYFPADILKKKPPISTFTRALRDHIKSLVTLPAANLSQ